MKNTSEKIWLLFMALIKEMTLKKSKRFFENKLKKLFKTQTVKN